jgi:hypothetical protein
VRNILGHLRERVVVRRQLGDLADDRGSVAVGRRHQLPHGHVPDGHEAELAHAREVRDDTEQIGADLLRRVPDAVEVSRSLGGRLPAVQQHPALLVAPVGPAPVAEAAATCEVARADQRTLTVGDDELRVQPARVADLDTLAGERLEYGEIGDAEVALLGNAVEKPYRELTCAHPREHLAKKVLDRVGLDPRRGDVEGAPRRARELASLPLDPILRDVRVGHSFATQRREAGGRHGSIPSSQPRVIHRNSLQRALCLC